jgi:hypothetical protein
MTRACQGPIRAAVGDAFSDEEIDDLVARLAARARRKGLNEPGAFDTDALRAAAAELTAEDLKEALIRRRMEAFAALARSKRAARFEGPVAELGRRLQDFNVGSSRQGRLAGLSVDAKGRAQADEWRAELIGALEAIEGALPRLNNWLARPDRDFERDVARELARLNGAERAAVDDPTATAVAAALKTTQDKALAALNARGAWIANLPGYVTRQNHDAIKVSGGFWKGGGWITPETARAAKARWIADIETKLDARTFEATDEFALRDLERTEARLTEARAAREAALARARRAADAAKRAGTRAKRAARVEALAAEMGDGPFDARAAALDQLGVGSEQALIARARRDFLGRIWMDIVLGKTDDGSDATSDLDGFTPPPGTARQVSRRRVLHFKDADAWMDYHERYGSGSFLETHLLGQERAARASALMEAWGPNPQAAFDAERRRLVAQAEKAGDVKAARAIMDGGRDREFAVLTGEADAPRGGSEARAAIVSRVLRMQQSMAKLGGMTITSISDMGSAATALTRAGVPLFDAYREVLAGVLRTQDADARRAGELVGVTMRAVAGDIAGNFATGDTMIGGLAKAQNIFYKVNLFELWQTGVRRGASTALARLLGDRVDRAFAALETGVREGLERFGIDQGLWDLLRARPDAGLDPEAPAARFLTPDAARAIGPEEAVQWLNPPKRMDVEAVRAARQRLKDALALTEMDQLDWDELPIWKDIDPARRAALERDGWTRSLWQRLREADTLDRLRDRTIANELKIPDIWTADQKVAAQDEARLRVQAWFSSFVDDALTEPRAAEKAVLTWGQRDGTALGVTLRLLTQFKSYPYTLITRNILPTLREANASLAAIRAGEADQEALGRPAMMLANTIVGLTLLGYVSGAAIDLMGGKEPRPVDDPRTWVAAFARGGGAGFYGDFLFAQYNRHGQGALAALAGPSVGTAEQLLAMFGKLRDGEDADANALRLAIANTPFLNLFYLRAALNYSILYQMQEAASPGYLDRLERRMQEEEGRGFWLPLPAVEAAEAAD